MKCKTCKYNLTEPGLYDTDIHCKYQICPFEIRDKRKKAHKCYNCHWGKITGNTIFCMLPRCMSGLGVFGGDKNVKTDDLQKDAEKLL